MRDPASAVPPRPGRPRRALLAAALLLVCNPAGVVGSPAGVVGSPAVAVEGPVRNQSLSLPREFGYTIGDEVALRIHFDLARSYSLDTEALPETGRVTRWLALNRVEVARGLGWSWIPHTVTLTFQVVNTSQAVLGVGTPPQSLRVVGPEEDFPVIVPAWGFTIAPITARSGRPEGSLPQLRPALLPPALETTGIGIRAAVAAAGAVLLAATLAYLHLWIPFLSRTRGPFARASRQIARTLRRQPADDTYAAVLGEMHRAFNVTAGRVVFEHDLDRFFRDHQRFESLREPITGVFQASTAAFFSGGAPPPSRERVRDLLELCRACRDRERGVA